jgi:hypothetical protein
MQRPLMMPKPLGPIVRQRWNGKDTIITTATLITGLIWWPLAIIVPAGYFIYRQNDIKSRNLYIDQAVKKYEEDVKAAELSRIGCRPSEADIARGKLLRMEREREEHEIQANVAERLATGKKKHAEVRERILAGDDCGLSIEEQLNYVFSCFNAENKQHTATIVKAKATGYLYITNTIDNNQFTGMAHCKVCVERNEIYSIYGDKPPTHATLRDFFTLSRQHYTMICAILYSPGEAIVNEGDPILVITQDEVLIRALEAEKVQKRFDVFMAKLAANRK